MTAGDRVLEFLRFGPKSAGEIGSALWPERCGRVTPASGGGDYAAQMLLGRLRKAGKVATVHRTDGGCTMWRLP